MAGPAVLLAYLIGGAALIGMVFGALGSGPLADRFGRKVVLVSAVVVFGGLLLREASRVGAVDTVRGLSWQFTFNAQHDREVKLAVTHRFGRAHV